MGKLVCVFYTWKAEAQRSEEFCPKGLQLGSGVGFESRADSRASVSALHVLTDPTVPESRKTRWKLQVWMSAWSSVRLSSLDPKLTWQMGIGVRGRQEVDRSRCKPRQEEASFQVPKRGTVEVAGSWN